MFESEEIFHLKIKVKELEEELEKAENEIDYYEQKATEVEKSIAKPSPSAYGLKEEHGALRKAHDEVLEVLAGNETDPETSLARSVLLRLRAAERLMVAEAPSPSAGAVPEGRPYASVFPYDGWNLVVSYKAGNCMVGEFPSGEAAQDAAAHLDAFFAKHWSHADAGGEYERAVDVVRRIHDAVWRHRLNEAESLCNAALAAGLAACQERDAEIERLRKALETQGYHLRNYTDAAQGWMARCLAAERAGWGRAAEREKTSEGARKEPPANRGTDHPPSSPAEAPQEPGATPAPCTRCDGRGSFSNGYLARKSCADCSGTGRAPASSPAPAAPLTGAAQVFFDGAPAAPEAKTSGLTHEEIGVACANIGVDLTCGQCASVFYTGSGSYPHTCKQATAAPEGCKIDIYSSRVCEAGTKSCVLKHPEARGDEDEPVDDVLLEWWQDMAGDPCWADIVSFVRAERARSLEFAASILEQQGCETLTTSEAAHIVRDIASGKIK